MRRTKEERHIEVMRRRYNTTQADYDRILAEQGGSCNLCNAVPKKAMFYVVKTIQGRSIICPKCHAKWYTKLKIPGTVKKQVRRADLLKRYGLTQEDYDRILDEQGGGCGICGKLYVPGQRVFHIDHDHVTGKTRGILCSTCNHLLGNAADSVGILESAVKYLLDCWSKR